MNGQTPSPEQNNSTVPEATAAPAAKHHNPLANIISRMSIMQMTLVAVLAVFLWQWLAAYRQVNNIQQDVARRLAEMEGNIKANQVLAMQGQESARELAAKVSLLEARYAEAQNQRASLEMMYQDLSSSRDEMVLADVEQMLFIAGQQLQLSANVKAALIAMQQAEDQLKRMDRVALNNLRTAIARDMDKLRALPNVDVSGINSSLDTLIMAVDGLSLEQDMLHPVQEGSPAVAAAVHGESVWQQLLREIWEDAKRLVRIENMHKNELPLLAPTQVFFLRENLKLRLLSARLALLSHDEVSFKHDLQLAQEWLVRYFDNKSSAATQTLATLHKLRQSNISIELPDISASLEAARNYRTSLVKTAR